jgi:hypothetical protein
VVIIASLVPLVEQELLTIPEHLRSPPVFTEVLVTRSLVLCVYFVDRCLYFFFWPLCCLFFFEIRILITSLVSPGHATIKHILRGLNFKNPCQCRNTDLIVKLAEVLFIIEFDNKYVSAVSDKSYYSNWNNVLYSTNLFSLRHTLAFLQNDISYNVLESCSNNFSCLEWSLTR